MIFKYFLLGNLVSLCMKIINSVVVVGLYYGFLTTFSIGPSYLFLLRARVMEEEEGTEKLVSAKTGFIMGQLMMFISIYYAPLHLALDRPHTITVLVLPYLLFHLFFECELCILQYKNRKRKSIRNLTITCVFLNNLIFQLLNQFLLPSSTLARLVNVYMFRSNNKMLFVTSSFVGWLIGHIFFMKWFGLVLFWIRKIIPSRPKKYIRFYGDYALEKEDLLAISLTLISIYYLGRMPSPTITRRVGKMRSEIPQRDENYLIWFEGGIVNSLFDYKQWNRPLRYIKNDNFQRPVIDEMSQYFFRIRPSYGKQIITFTCPPSLSTLWKMIQRKFECYSPSQIKKPPGLYRSLVYINREKRRNLCNEFINRIKALGKGAPALDVLEKRTRLYNQKNKQNYLPKAYDPFLSGPYRKKLRGIMNSPGIYTTKSWINRIHRLLVISFPELINTRDEDASITVKVLHKILVPDTDQYLRSDLRRSKIIERRRIRRKVPRWSYNLNTDSQDAEKENADEPTEYYAVLLRKYDRLVVYSDEDDQEINVNSDGELEEKIGEIALLDYPRERDPYRGLIKGSMRAQRRKIPILRVYQPLFQSPLFLGRIRGAAFTSFVNIIELWKYFFRNWLGKDPKFEVSTSDSEIEEEELVKSESIWLEEMEIEDDDPLLERGKEFFDEMLYQGFDDVVLGLQGSRSLSLIAQSIFRKYILLPSTIIVKNIVRALFFKTPEWDADWRDWKKELHIYCTYNGVQISDRELPRNWLMGGIQIRVLFPFYPKPWRKSKLRSDPMKEKKRNADWKNKRKGKTKDSFYLTPWGGAKEKPFGPLKEQPSFFKPIWKKLEKRMRKELKKKSFSTLIRSFLIKGFSFLQEMPGILEEKIRWIQKITLFKKEKINEFTKENSSFLFPSELSKVHKPHKNRKDSRLSKKFRKKQAVQRSPAVRTNFSRTQKNDIFIRRMIVIREINNIAEELERRKMFLTPDRNSSSPYETDWSDKRSESQKHIWQILKGKSVRFIRKWECFVYSFIERIYVDIFLCTINSFRIHAQPFFESSKKTINKYIDNIEKNKEEISETNKNTIHFISTLKESLFHITNISNEESEISRDLSSLSQAYVFYNLSQTQVINKYHLRSVLQDHGARLFFKDRIKEYLWTLGILDAKSSSKRLPNSGMNEWKNWLRGHYQYNFSQTRWSRLVSQKWRNKVRKRHMSQNKESKKNSYEKDQSIHCEKQKNYIMNSLPIQKYKFTKNYRYDLLSHKYIHYEDKKDSYSYISISDYLGDNDTDKNMGRKYLEWRTLLYFSRKNIGIKHRINRDTGTNIKKKTKTGTNNYQIMDNKDLFSLTIHQERNPSNQKNFFDWMGMNEEMLYRSISNQEIETWFFSELVPLYDAYKSKPRIIPIKLLFLNNESFSEQEKRYLREFEEYLRKEKEAEKKEKEQSDQKNLGSDPPNQQKDLFVDSAESDIKNRRKQSQSKKDISGPQLNLLMRKHLVSQLNINSSLNLPEIMDIRTFSFLLKMMKYSNDVDIYSIEIGDIRMNFLATLRRLTYPILDVPTFIKRGIITIEPIRLFLKLDGQSIMYQIIGISLVHKNKHQTNEICREKKYDLLVPENIPSTRRRRELRIRICFNSASGRIVDRYPVLVDRYNMRDCVHFLGEDRHIDTDRKKLIQFKLFLWPNYRLEDLACMNRYWFDTNNGSRFSMSRIYMYPLQN
uniref:hypothetical chloroplast RF1 n=1 Tax=Alphonsea hainanensis TaxID=1370097 RepID=UPI0022FD3EE3|nr:hypothetical chloroplast RF1 [Alphonsea hainanensis]WBG68680.1 hypothetical chloroplast RF1 [Alphonsea hainanensis]